MTAVVDRLLRWLGGRTRPWERAQALQAAVRYHDGTSASIRVVIETAQTFDTYIRTGGDQRVR